MFTQNMYIKVYAALFIIAPNWKQHTLSMGELFIAVHQCHEKLLSNKKVNC
jgi:hypothetical protein